jgi:hypothetical protein
MVGKTKRQQLMAWPAVASLILMSVVGCAGLPDVDLRGPESVAGEWYEAVGAFDAPGMCMLTHPERRVHLDLALRNPLVTLGAIAGLQEREYFDMRYTLVFDDGQAAQVHVTGMFANRLGMLQAVDQTIELRRLEGRWYVWSADGWF